MLWHCWLGDRKGIRPVKKLDDGLLVVMIWLGLFTTYSSSSPVVTTTSIILCFNKRSANPGSPGKWPLKWRDGERERERERERDTLDCFDYDVLWKKFPLDTGQHLQTFRQWNEKHCVQFSVFVTVLFIIILAQHKFVDFIVVHLTVILTFSDLFSDYILCWFVLYVSCQTFLYRLVNDVDIFVELISDQSG